MTAKDAPASWTRVFRRKPVAHLIAEAADAPGGEHLPRSIGLFQLTMLGISCTVGTGIFVILDEVVPQAGPAVILSFLIAGFTAGLSALCYAELASMMPISGSSYSYAYATLGEIVAFAVAWCLLLEYGVAASAVAVGWGQYLNELLADLFGWRLPAAISEPPGRGGQVNLPSIVLVAMCCLLLIRSTGESARINAVMVIVKITILLLFVAIALTAFSGDRLLPFAPSGWPGISMAASTIFFTYVGLDSVSTAGEEVKNPRRTLPLAIIFALVTVTGLYLLVALAAVGAQSIWTFGGHEVGLVAILREAAGGGWPSVLFSAGAVVSIFSVTLVTLYGQTRILFAMARDGMLPAVFHRLDPRSMTPVRNTIIVGATVAACAAIAPLDVLANLTSMGTLMAFAVVSVGVMILRRTQPDLPRGFRVPFYPVLPVLSLVMCLYLMVSLPIETILIFAAWLGIAAVVYFSYSIRRSQLAPQKELSADPPISEGAGVGTALVDVGNR
ncbi:amino acid permease [Inquilinus limosus]|uniref:amino acid permease n=1 Tax=Inquilinus limosus TaxID=171674 RepID=UPI003F17A7B6